MAFPASQQTLRSASKTISDEANNLKTKVQNLRDLSAVGPVERRRFINLQEDLQSAIAAWDAAAIVPGLLQYMKDQYDDQALNITTEYNAMRAAAIALQLWIFTNIPTHAGSGAVLLETVDLQGVKTNITNTSAQLSGFRTEADLFLATIS